VLVSSGGRGFLEGVIPELPPLPVEKQTFFPLEWVAALERVLPEYLQCRRWFGGKGQGVVSVRLAGSVEFACGARWVVVEVELGGGRVDEYLMALQWVRGQGARQILEEEPQAVLVRMGDGVVIDALWDEKLREELWGLIFGERSLRGDGMVLRGRRAAASLCPKRGEILVAEASVGRDSRVLRVEQSNSGVVYGGAWMLKLFRKRENGGTREATILGYLTEGERFLNVVPLLGTLELEFGGGGGRCLAGMLVGFLPGCKDGWERALGRLSELFQAVREGAAENEGDAQAPKGRCDEILNEEIRLAGLLGRRTAELHLALAGVGDLRAEDSEIFGIEAMDAAWGERALDAMQATAARVFESLELRLKEGAWEESASGLQLMAAKERVAEMGLRLVAREFGCARMLIHGDFHLGQVLFTGTDFYPVDFEGEPARSVAEGWEKRPALADVAGMLRSFDYACRVACQGRFEQGGSDERGSEWEWAQRWLDGVRGAFWERYWAEVQGTQFVPRERERAEELLRVLLVEKALYELGYELTFRPAMAGIPLRALLVLVRE
jgi:maltose alpha-D-glucosyltransferase/alpha-amylase